MGDIAQSARAWLSELTSLYTPTSHEFDAARNHRQSIEIRLDVYLGLQEMFEIGSLRHGTGVWTYSDADYLAVLKGFQPGSPWTMLNKVKETLQDRFPNTSVAIRRPAVVCTFSDGVVEVVPAYSSAGGGYSIANPADDGWLTTFPRDHNNYVNDINTKHSGAVKKLARQVKVWKYRRNVPISSCYLEMRTAKYMANETTYSPLWDLYGTLRDMRDVGLAAMNDPTGLGSRFGSCSSESNRLEAMSKFETVVTRARKAKDYAHEGDEANAIYQLELLFDR